MRCKLLGIGAGILGLASILGAGPGAPAAPENTTEMRVYDVRDLVMVVQDYPLTGPLLPPTRLGESVQAPLQGGGGGPPFGQASAPPPPLAPIDAIQHLIESSVMSVTWKENGGADGSIAALNGQLFVTQTAENQSLIQNLLTQLRNTKAVMVRVRADWVLLGPGQIEQLMKNGGKDPSPVPDINRDAMEKLPQSVTHYSSQIACFSGQTVHLASGEAKTFVADATPIVATGAVGYETKPQYIQYGLALQVMPMVTADSATLDLLNVVSESGAASTAPMFSSLASTQPSIDLGIDRLNAVVQRFHTSVQVPLNRPVLVGGMTLNPKTSDPSGLQLYLIVEASVAK